MTEEKIGVQNDVEIETIETATTDVCKAEEVTAENTTVAENEKKDSDDDYILVVNDLKE